MSSNSVANSLFARLSEIVKISVLKNPTDTRFRERLDEWRKKVLADVQFQQRQSEVVEHAASWKAELQRIKNALYALNSFDNRDEMIQGYIDFCLVRFPVPPASYPSLTADHPPEISHRRKGSFGRLCSLLKSP